MKTCSLLSRTILCALVSVLAACATFTAPKPRAYTIRVELDPAMVGRSIDIHLIGANSGSDLPKWRSYSMTTYWSATNRDAQRDADKVVLKFLPRSGTVQVLSAADPVWQRWFTTGAAHLVVMADLMGVPTDHEGSADPRRLILPLDAREWPRGVQTIELRVQETGIRLLTARKLK